MGTSLTGPYAIQEAIHLLALEGSSPIDPDKATEKLRELHPELIVMLREMRREVIDAAERLGIEVKPEGEVSTEAP